MNLKTLALVSFIVVHGFASDIVIESSAKVQQPGTQLQVVAADEKLNQTERFQTERIVENIVDTKAPEGVDLVVHYIDKAISASNGITHPNFDRKFFLRLMEDYKSELYRFK